MRPRSGRLLAVVAVVACTLAGCRYSATPAPPAPEPRFSLSALLGGDSAGFARADGPRRLAFPADYGPHPAFRQEWWYFTGNLDTRDGRHFGYQLTFFRFALTPTAPHRGSPWATNQVYMADFAVTDVNGRRFYAGQRFSRAALGLAGAQAQPFRVWIDDWSAAGTGRRVLPIRLRASRQGVAIGLSLDTREPPVLQGDHGWSRKGAQPGNASYYYSLTDLHTRGRVRIGNRTYTVAGTSWMDHEWSTSALAEDQVGWDWFALQLSDGRQLMFYRLRRRNGTIDPHSAGTLVDPDGAGRPLPATAVTVDVLDYWTSPHSGVRYPSRWRLRLPGDHLTLELTPYLSDQELNLAVRYWEGAVRVQGTADGRPVTGSGYVELTGYGRDATASDAPAK